YYLPGVGPRDYEVNDRVELTVNALSSPDSLLPYDFYNSQFDFCIPEGGPKPRGESLGSVLFGDRLYGSAFELSVGVNSTCNVLCKRTVSKYNAKFINKRIKESYTMNWFVDGLPVAQAAIDRKTKQAFFNIGFALGIVENNKPPALHNHYDIQIQYHTNDDVHFRVVGVLV
ncbi:hypothetical protein BDK51DRAFT_3425, partial [Blyttiomyces helicus]